MAPLFSIILACILLWPISVLTAESGDRVLFMLPIAKGDTFSIRFTHSLNLSPVEDVFEYSENRLVLRKSIFKTFGAGIPVPADGIGTELVHVNGEYELLGIDTPFTSFTLMTQTIPNHYICFKKRDFNLLSLVGSGKQVVISVKRVPRFIIVTENSFRK